MKNRPQSVWRIVPIALSLSLLPAGITLSAFTTNAAEDTSTVQVIVHAGLGEDGAAVADRIGDDDAWETTGEPTTSDDVAVSAETVDSAACVTFDGTVGLTLTDLPVTSKNNIAVEAWIRPTSEAPGSRMIVKYGGNGGFGIEQQKGGVWGVIYGKATVGFHQLELDAWTHVALVIENETSTLYVNGAASGSADATPWGYDANAGMTIGIKPGNETGGFEGDIDELRVFTFEDFDDSELLYWQ
ncbi:MAG: LamG domain-containing protein [Planctomycetota bacterium]